MTYFSPEAIAAREALNISSWEPPKVHFYLVFFRDSSGVWGGDYTPSAAKQNAVDNWASMQDDLPSKDAREGWLRNTVLVKMTAPLDDFLAYVWPRINDYESARAPWNSKNHPPTPYEEKRQW